MEAVSTGFPSDTNMLVDACIARVRETARLDDDPILPRVLPRRGPPPLPRTGPPPLPMAAHDILIIPAPETSDVQVIARPRAAPTVMTRPAAPIRPARPARWPLMLCGFVAVVAASTSFFVSPQGRRPEVQRVTNAAERSGTKVVETAVAFFRSRG